ncbi:Ribosomal protein L1 family and Ribosomal protein L1, 2-layer alpha/beta-sandwich domain and Ribosomal protein L1-like domain-containing protein [Strongyloides ratti]|uniref:Ribosomal protein L1 family and Ribosomal protein L1, 2-layer alpha/beta-sandwich domain and Ribosomal protein L1-like domain-containing protein n=1 Tax=Strongyloides ratti TaxID=34506 RepID=A0A090L191_STRRB|nr:Ribosomal protein L1 family and Ribosomal protein L1, 2-layer alpha/beta-sandwich domain and Ribosomal protein L1-like domain-containing protein [Strongyloides ratti]CEF63476.1 Ribosomal protein L1 family and Ribosomal protein L1, 2-layer alpha/beta-sandwich domain and Ribosomal protein L1-like domain-containing protein [Strongyloides ratti]
MGKKSPAKSISLSKKAKEVPKNGVNKQTAKVTTKKISNNDEKISCLENKDTIFDTIVEKVEDAVKCQKEYASKLSKNSLFPDVDNALSLTFTLKRLAPGHQSSTKFVDLPFPERSFENTSVCLILPDIAKTKEVNTNADTEIESREWAEVLEEKFGIDKSFYSKIYTLRQLRREVKGYEAIKSFSRTYDVYMSASNIFKSTISHLGKNFLKANKTLYPLCLKSHPKERIENAVKKVAVRINPSKLNMLSKIGNTSQKENELVKNAEVVLKAFIDNVPGGLENIRCIYLGNVGGVVSLPVYVSAGNPDSVKIPKPKHLIDTEAEVVDEVSTIVNDNIVVGVTKSGKINFRNATTKELLGKKRKNPKPEEKDANPPKITKKDNVVSLEKDKDAIPDTLTKKKEVKVVNKKAKEESSLKVATTTQKKAQNGIKIASVKSIDVDMSNDKVINKKINTVVTDKKEKSDIKTQQTPKNKKVVEKKNTNNSKVVNGKRELTPPTLRLSARQKAKEASKSKIEQVKPKVDTPFKPIPKAPKVFVAETSNGKSAVTKKVNVVSKKKTNGTVKKNK